jgi:hypothetical protein
MRRRLQQAALAAVLTSIAGLAAACGDDQGEDEVEVLTATASADVAPCLASWNRVATESQRALLAPGGEAELTALAYPDGAIGVCEMVVDLGDGTKTAFTSARGLGQVWSSGPRFKVMVREPHTLVRRALVLPGGAVSLPGQR